MDAELVTRPPAQVKELFWKLHTRLPIEMTAIRSLVASTSWRSPDHWETNPDPT